MPETAKHTVFRGQHEEVERGTGHQRVAICKCGRCAGEGYAGGATGQPAESAGRGYPDCQRYRLAALDDAYHLYGHLHWRVRGDVLLHYPPPQVGRLQAIEVSRARGRGSGLDSRPLSYRGSHGATRHQNRGGHERHLQCRPHCQSNRLSMEMGLRVYRRRRARRQLPFQPHHTHGPAPGQRASR